MKEDSAWIRSTFARGLSGMLDNISSSTSVVDSLLDEELENFEVFALDLKFWKVLVLVFASDPISEDLFKSNTLEELALVDVKFMKVLVLVFASDPISADLLRSKTLELGDQC